MGSEGQEKKDEVMRVIFRKMKEYLINLAKNYEMKMR